MTRALLQQALDALENICDIQSNPGRPHITIHDYGKCRQSAIEIRAHLAKPEDAPEWHDVPTVPGLWVSSSNDASFRLDAYDVEQIDRFNPRWSRWFGPIPQDAK